ncbi:MAG: hypothetical protein K9I85_13075 [Saprospiraceae bacterium]|nr:hypothetical protein [Saprospiraceae bacterium]
MKYITILLIALLSLASSCQKEDPFPPEDYHKDIFRCKVNGVEWTPHCISDPLFGCDAVDCQYYWKDTKGFEISAVNISYDKTTNESIHFFVRPANIGDSQLLFLSREYKDWNQPSGCRFHDLDTTAVRRLTILEVDTVKYLIKGSFEFTAINECQDTVQITDGYFHVNFRA